MEGSLFSEGASEGIDVMFPFLLPTGYGSTTTSFRPCHLPNLLPNT